MSGEPITGSDRMQYEMTWSEFKDQKPNLKTYLIDNNEDEILMQARRVLQGRSRQYYLHIKRCGPKGRTLYYNRGF